MVDTNSDISAMSDDELMEAWTRTGDDAAQLKERLTAFSHEHQRRTQKADVQRLLGIAGMTPEELDQMKSLVQAMEPVGTESQELVGEQNDNTEGEDI